MARFRGIYQYLFKSRRVTCFPFDFFRLKAFRVLSDPAMPPIPDPAGLWAPGAALRPDGLNGSAGDIYAVLYGGLGHAQLLWGRGYAGSM